MQVTETSVEGLRREYTVVVPAAEIEDRVTGRLTELGNSVRVPGFRPGKVPIPLLRKRYGEAVRGEVLAETIQNGTEQAITDQGLRPALEPKIEIVTNEDGADLEYKVAVEVLPEIEPPEFGDIALTRYVVQVPDEAVERTLERLAEQHRHHHPAPEGHAAAEGDQVKIDFVGRVDGEAFEGGSAEDLTLELGAERFLPGFEHQLIGAKAGETRAVTVAFPEDYPHDALKGKEAVFDVTIKEIEAAEQHALDDELAKHLGLDDLAALRAAVREQVEREYGALARSRIKRDLLDRLADRAAFEVPPGLVDSEFESIWEQVQRARERGELDEDDRDTGEEELRQRYREIALRRVRLGLLLADIGQKNNISVTQDDIHRALGEQARRFPGHEAQIFEFYQRNQQAMQELQAPIFEDKVIDFLLEMVKVEDKPVSPEELSAVENEDEREGGAAAPEPDAISG